MNVNTETRETARVSNALDALKAARSAMRLADKKASDALSVVERHCPRDRGNKCGYDTWHPTYQTYKRALAELKDSQRNYYVEYLTTARGAVKRGDAETFWQTLAYFTSYSTTQPGKMTPYDGIDWVLAEAAGDKLCDCDTFRALAIDLTNNHTLSRSKTLIKILEHLVSSFHEKIETGHILATRIVEHAATAIINSDANAHSAATGGTVFADLCARAYLITADDADSDASKIGSLVIASDADNAGSLVIDAGRYFLTTQDTGDLTQSAAKWRSIINRSESGAQSHVAQYAHMMITVTLLVYHNTITADDLATLIDTFQEHEDAHPDRNMRRIGFYVPEAPLYPITTVEQLIDYAGARMSVS